MKTSRGILIHVMIGGVASFQRPVSIKSHTSPPSPMALQEPIESRQHSPWYKDPSNALQLKSSKANPEADSEGDSSWNWFFALVLPLLFVYISNQWSRSSLYYLVNFSEDAKPFSAMNVDIGFSQSEYGLLASLGFTALFAIASLGAGAAADRFDRKLLTVVAALGWGVATLGTALSSSYPQVLGWRILMGLACAFTTPTAYTLINDRVPNEQKAFATSIYGTGVALGGALAALSILLDNSVGWKQSTTIVSIVAFISAIIAFVATPGDDKRTVEALQSASPYSDEQERTRSVVDDFFEVLSTERAKWLFLGTLLRFAAGLSIGVWSASYYKMTFPDNASEYAVSQALITAVAGSSSGLIGGAIADWFTVNSAENKEEDANGKKLWIPVVGSVLAAPTFYMALHADSFQSAMAWLSIEYLVAECWFGPTISVMLTTVGSKVGGTAQGLFTLTGGVANLAPTALGWLYSRQLATDASAQLNDVLTTAVCLAYLSSAFCFAISTQKSTRTITSKED